MKESCGTESQIDDKSVPGDPGGETTVEKATNNQGTVFNISFIKGDGNPDDYYVLYERSS